MATPPSDLISGPSPDRKKSSDGPPSDLISVGDSAPKKERPTLGERGMKVAEEGVGGVAAASVFPEILMGGGRLLSKVPYGPVKGLGYATTAAGEMLRAERAAAPLATMAVGGIAGAGGETSAQVAELAGAGDTGQEISRLIGGVGFSMAPGATMSMLRKIALPGIGKDVGSIYKEIINSSGMREESLSALQKKAVQAIAQRISQGTLESNESARVVRSAIRAGAEDLQNAYSAQSFGLERQADDIVRQAQAFAASRSSDAAAKVDSLNAEFNKKASEMMNTANAVANRIRQGAKARAEQIRAMSIDAGMRPNQAAMQTQGVLNAAEAEAKQVVADASAHVQRLRSVADKARDQASKMTEKGTAALRGVGEPATRSQRGEALRERVVSRVNSLKATREANAEKNKRAAFGTALEKERAGGRVNQTQSFKDLVSFIDQSIKNPETKLTDVPVDQIRSKLTEVKSALQGRNVNPQTGEVIERPVSFQGLDVLRRYLNDRAYGLPSEGYDAISQQQAGKLAQKIEAVMEEFSPEVRTFIDQYKKDSEPLRAFKTKVGQNLVGKEDFDLSRFSADSATLSDQIFKSKNGVNLMIEMLGGDRVAAEQMARAHVADELLNADAKGVRSYLNNKNTRDWIDTFPGLKRDLETAASTMERVSGLAAKRQALSDALRGKAEKEITALPGRIEDIAGRVVSAGEKEAGEKLSAAEATRAASERKVGERAGAVVSAAEREGKEAVSAAEAEARGLRKEAGRLSKEGQDIASRIVGKQFDELEVRNLILSGNESLWSEVAPIINRDAEARETVVDFIKRYMGDAAASSPRQVTDAWKTRIRPAMERFNLADQGQIEKLDSQIASLSRVVDEKARVTSMQKLLRSVFATEAGRPLSSLLNVGFRAIPN